MGMHVKNKTKRSCLKCRGSFLSLHLFNRICSNCKGLNENLPILMGVQYAAGMHAFPPISEQIITSEKI